MPASGPVPAACSPIHQLRDLLPVPGHGASVLFQVGQNPGARRSSRPLRGADEQEAVSTDGADHLGRAGAGAGTAETRRSTAEEDGAHAYPTRTVGSPPPVRKPEVGPPADVTSSKPIATMPSLLHSLKGWIPGKPGTAHASRCSHGSAFFPPVEEDKGARLQGGSPVGGLTKPISVPRLWRRTLIPSGYGSGTYISRGPSLGFRDGGHRSPPHRCGHTPDAERDRRHHVGKPTARIAGRCHAAGP